MWYLDWLLEYFRPTLFHLFVQQSQTGLVTWELLRLIACFDFQLVRAGEKFSLKENPKVGFLEEIALDPCQFWLTPQK